MPTYEYRCANGHAFERVQRMTESPVAECPECGAPAERLLSAGAGLLFKGSGFYITDYRSESYKKAEAADTGAKPEPKTDAGAKPEPKTDAGSKKSDSAGGSSGASE
jgi:putative FmdB family regulatory protein